MSATLIAELPANFAQSLREVSEGSGIFVHLIRCTDCKASWVGDDGDRIVIKHTRSCDFKNAVNRPTAAQVAQAVEKAEAAKNPSMNGFARAARNGNAAQAGCTADDLVLMVNCGAISMSNAMNQDM